MARRARAGHFPVLVERDDAVCLLARSRGTPVGHLAGLIRRPAAIRPAEIAEVQSMYVSEDHRGDGLGRDLVGRFRACSRDLDAGRISVTAYATNQRAIRFYESMGFNPKSITLEAPP